jgi:TatD DNase family protein
LVGSRRDAPDQPPARQRGRRNEPALLVEVLDAVARLRGAEPDAIAAVTTANAERMFGLRMQVGSRP